MSSSTFFEPLERAQAFKDLDGETAYVKAELDDIRIVWDLTDYLASGETVSSAAYEESGATASSKSVATPQIIFTATGLGEIKVTATLSTGRTKERFFRFYPKESAKITSDYP